MGKQAGNVWGQPLQGDQQRGAAAAQHSGLLPRVSNTVALQVLTTITCTAPGRLAAYTSRRSLRSWAHRDSKAPLLFWLCMQLLHQQDMFQLATDRRSI